MEPKDIKEALEKFNFIPSVYSAEEEREICDHAETYKEWDILLCIPNGGITAAVIVKGEQAYQFCVDPNLEEFPFDYLDEDGIIAHCKSAIDEIHGLGVLVNGLLELMEIDDRLQGRTT